MQFVMSGIAPSLNFKTRKEDNNEKIDLCVMSFTVSVFTTAGAEPTFTINNVLAEATPDECYAGLGVDYPNGISGYNPTSRTACPATVTLDERRHNHRQGEVQPDICMGAYAVRRQSLVRNGRECILHDGEHVHRVR